jgi:hypothetical protein
MIASLIEDVAGGKRSRLLYPVAVTFVLIAKVIILTKVLTVAELIGSAISFVLWLALLECQARPRARVLTALFAALVIAQRLEPFKFRSTAGHFGLVPFISFMDSSLSINIQSFFEKFFLYGSLLWLSVKTGMRWAWATSLIAGLLLVTSLVEVYLPGRSAEVTDPVMALMIGIIFALVTRASENANHIVTGPGVADD